jgi:uncharacterized membrane protein
MLLFIAAGFIRQKDDFFPITVLVMTEFLIIILGLIFLMCRLLKVQLKKTNFIYSLTATLNAIFAALSLMILINDGFDIRTSVAFLLNIAIATFIYYDIFRKVKQSS